MRSIARWTALCCCIALARAGEQAVVATAVSTVTTSSTTPETALTAECDPSQFVGADGRCYHLTTCTGAEYEYSAPKRTWGWLLSLDLT